jgi:hypothetical protein
MKLHIEIDTAGTSGASREGMEMANGIMLIDAGGEIKGRYCEGCRRAAVSANNELPAEERLEIVPNDRNGETCDRCGEVE